MPISAPKPYWAPSASRVLAFQKTLEESTSRRNRSAVARLPVTIASLWALPYCAEGKALRHAAALKATEGFTCAGSADWRVPTREELFSLTDATRFNPAIDPEFFPDTKSDWHWSSTPYANNPADYAWGVYFNYGHTDIYLRVSYGFVRAVRSVAPAAPGQ